jgi:hypothetical protein
MKSMEIENHGIHASVMVEGDHEGDNKDSLFEHKHHKIRQIPSHTLLEILGFATVICN